MEFSYTHPTVQIFGSPQQQDIGQHTIKLYIDTSGSNIPDVVLGPYTFEVLNVDDNPDISNIDILIGNVIIAPNTDISQGDTLDISFTIRDIDVSANSFNNNTIHNFLEDASFSYQWYRNSSAISNAVNLSYTLTQEDVSYII